MGWMQAAQIGLAGIGAMSQMQYQKSALGATRRMVELEANMAMAAAQTTRDSAEDALTDQQADTREVGEQKKSDAARVADRESAELVAAMAEKGQLSTLSFLRQAQQLQYFAAMDDARIDHDVKARIASLQADKEQVVEDQKKVYNSAQLSLYSSNVNYKLGNAFAKQRAFMQIASAGTGAYVDNLRHEQQLEAAKNLS